MFNIFNHLLPKSRAFKITIDKNLRKLIKGIADGLSPFRLFFDSIWAEINPYTTNSLSEWESKFAIIRNGLTLSERRDRVNARWKELGGQSPKYLQDTLQSYGFDVYIHEWWTGQTLPDVNVKQCVNAINPATVLANGSPVYTIQCGEPLAQCGEPLAQCGQLSGAGGYILVNKIYESSLSNFECGELLAQCGEPLAQCGETFGYSQVTKKYTLPIDQDKWHYFVYVGGQNFGDFATIDGNRKDEFERLCLRIFPAQNWLGILVQYN
jgi:hypothetical protein